MWPLHQNHLNAQSCSWGLASTRTKCINIDLLISLWEKKVKWTYSPKRWRIPLKIICGEKWIQPWGKRWAGGEDGEEKRWSTEMPKVIILMRHEGVHSLVFVCVIVWLGLQPLPTVKESTREENRGCPFHLPPPNLSLWLSLYKCLAVLRMAGSNFPQCVN